MRTHSELKMLQGATMINTDWLNPEFNIIRVAHVELLVTDLARSRAFYVDTLGLIVTEETSDALDRKSVV